MKLATEEHRKYEIYNGNFMDKLVYKDITGEITGAAFEVYTNLG